MQDALNALPQAGRGFPRSGSGGTVATGGASDDGATSTATAVAVAPPRKEVFSPDGQLVIDQQDLYTWVFYPMMENKVRPPPWAARAACTRMSLGCALIMLDGRGLVALSPSSLPRSSPGGDACPGSQNLTFKFKVAVLTEYIRSLNQLQLAGTAPRAVPSRPLRGAGG